MNLTAVSLLLITVLAGTVPGKKHARRVTDPDQVETTDEEKAVAQPIPVKLAGPATTLITMKRLYVDQLAGGPTSDQMRDMLISSLSGSQILVITEDETRADVILKGSSEDLLYTDEHNSSDSLNANIRSGLSSSSKSSGLRSSDSDTRNTNSGISIGQNETMHSAERKHEASAAVRLVNSDGDVIWSTTQESRGGKFKGSMADVADKITRKLVDDVRRARLLNTSPSASATSPAPNK